MAGRNGLGAGGGFVLTRVVRGGPLRGTQDVMRNRRSERPADLGDFLEILGNSSPVSGLRTACRGRVVDASRFMPAA